jgi:hypothetical protein
MSLPPTYSRRKRQAEKTGADVYVYDRVPQKVRVQVVQILREGLGPYSARVYGPSDYALPTAEGYDFLYNQMRRELGVHQLLATELASNDLTFLLWLQQEQDIDYWLTAVELALQYIDVVIRPKWEYLSLNVGLAETPDEIISELNARLHEAGVGYEYSERMMIRKDSEIIHRDVVIPVLSLLKAPKFAAADKEFREAHEAFRQGRLDDCIAKCGNALESVLKVIGHARKWPIKDTDTAKALIQAGIKTGFLAPYFEATLTHLRCLIESSTPTLRNREGGHGAGLTPRVVPPHLASFQLHQTAAVILFLAEQDAALLP